MIRGQTSPRSRPACPALPPGGHSSRPCTLTRVVTARCSPGAHTWPRWEGRLHMLRVRGELPGGGALVAVLHCRVLWDRAHLQAGVPGVASAMTHTLHPTLTLYTIHSTPNTQHSTPYTLHPTPYTLPHTPHIVHPTPHIHTLHPGGANLLAFQPRVPGVGSGWYTSARRFRGGALRPGVGVKDRSLF